VTGKVQFRLKIKGSSDLMTNAHKEGKRLGAGKKLALVLE
jgi:hypothetical protein